MPAAPDARSATTNRTVIRRGTVIADGGRERCDLVVEQGRIVDLRPPSSAASDAEDEVIDADGLLVAAGFIDAQINGGHGIDLAAEPERLWELGAVLAQHGVTAFAPTIVSSPDEIVQRALVTLHDRPATHRGAEPVGLHLEGPMLNPARKGAHREAWLRPPSIGLVGGWARETGVVMVTIAPELPGATEVVRHLVDEGVVVSLGHTDAMAEAVVAALDAGAGAVTHLFNAMAPFHHRAPGPIGVALADHRATAGLIADGIHVDPVAVAAAFAALGPARLMLVTDAVGALGLAAGTTRLGSDTVTIGADGVRLADGTLAGSDLSMPRAVANLVRFAGCRLDDALACASSTPARLLRLEGRGEIAVGARADLVLLEDDEHGDVQVVATLVDGEVVFRRAG